MVQINFARREVNCKLVYYGPGLSGKTTNLEIIHKKVPENSRGSLTSIATEQDRTLFFDFLPLDIGQVAGMTTKFFLYTVPGQVYYNSTRKLVLQGVDGVCFVADSSPDRMNDNIDSLRNLMENLREYGLDPLKIPFVMQYNKRDIPGALSIAELQAKLNTINVPYVEAVAVKGDGVLQTLKALARIVLERLNEEYATRGPSVAAPAPARPPVPAAPPAARVTPAPAPAMPPAARVTPAPAPAVTPAARVTPVPAPAPAVRPAPAVAPVQRPAPAPTPAPATIRPAAAAAPAVARPAPLPSSPSPRPASVARPAPSAPAARSSVPSRTPTTGNRPPAAARPATATPQKSRALLWTLLVLLVLAAGAYAYFFFVLDSKLPF